MNQRVHPNTIFLLGFLLHTISYGLPFMTYEYGYELFEEGIKAFISGYISLSEAPLFYAVFMPIFSLPVLAWLFYKEKIIINKWGTICFLLICFFIPLTILVYYTNKTGFPGLEAKQYSGFVVWVFTLISLAAYYYHHLSKNFIFDKGDDEDDFTNHLIDEAD